ncbi:hypothetical protein PybrP1_012637 [[Pythium] brassicae (nom. inval.)]|nr:hypothetical protein PybrP1_012637 [[Pythium] brassicae (nom. inval.)]
MLPAVHPPQLVSSIARRSSLRGSSFLSREPSTEESCAYVDHMIHDIQQQIKRELGFKEIVVATGDEAFDDSASSAAPTADSVSGVLIPHSHSSGSLRSSLTAPPGGGGGGSSSVHSSYSDDVRQVVGDEVWESFNSSRRGYLYGLRPKTTSDTPSDGSSCSDCAKGTVYVSPYYQSKKRVLVIVPYREAGIWSRSICMQQTSASDNSGSMLAYLKKALAENYGVVIMNPAAQVCHPSHHVEQAWDQLVAPLESDVFIVAFSRGCQYVKHLLNHDNGTGCVQDRVKALALVEPSHYVSESDTYFARRILARRAVAWILSAEIDVGVKIPKGEARHGCVCVSAGVVPMHVQGSSGAWALEIVMSSVFGSFAARCGEAAGVTVNDAKINACGICHRKLGVLNRRIPCAWCEVKHCSKCCEDKFVPAFGSWRVCSLCQLLPCLIDPRRKNKSAPTHKSPTAAAADDERVSVFIKPSGDDAPVALHDFEIIKLIGRGACGRVKLVRKNHGADEGRFYAMKAIRKKLVIQRGLVEATNAERRILDRTNHVYVATLCYAFQTAAKLYLLSEYYPGGNLLDQMRLARRFSEDRTRLEDDRLGCGEHGFEHLMRHPWLAGLDWDKVAAREETFEGQAELMKSHAKAFRTADIFDTFMNTIEVPVDTPASVKSATSELFGDFAFNFMDDLVGDDTATDTVGDNDSGAASGADDDDDDDSDAAATTTPAPPSLADAEVETFLTSADSQFDISLLRPDRATDFGLSESSASELSSESGTEEVVTVVDTVSDPALTTVGPLVKPSDKPVEEEEEQAASSRP